MSQSHETDKNIYIAFRFHVNFYHSYRGDSLDEKGIGKDIRIIRHILDTLERLNGQGIDVCGTWDIENGFSLENIMPQHCPDLLRRIQERVARGQDEIEPMSYNNGIVSAHNREEFDYVAAATISNARGSGIADLFSNWEPIVRPQECMYTPSFLRLYPEHGINAISLYYSCHPFNGFSNFVPKLAFAERYNPLWLEAPGIEGRMTLLPCYNIGDVVDHISLRRWVRAMRREQLREAKPPDLLLLLDMDADDDFWTGYGIPLASSLYSTAGGLQSIARSVAGLSYVRFAKPGDYLRGHEPAGTVHIGQDTADGSFDGYSSWTEKWQNKQLWTGIERSRLIASQARALGCGKAGGESLNAALRSRVLALSTTHFGLASPVMNAARLGKGATLVRESVAAAKAGLEQAIGLQKAEPGKVRLLFANPVEEAKNPGAANRLSPKGRCLVRLGFPEGWPEGDPIAFCDERGVLHPAFARSVFGRPELCFSLETDKADARLTVEKDVAGCQCENPVETDGSRIGNRFVSIELESGYPCIRFNGQRYTAPGFPRCAVRYGEKLVEAAPVKLSPPRLLAGGAAAVLETSGEAALSTDAGPKLEWKCQYTIVSGLPYVYVDVELVLPKTPDYGYNKGRAARLGRGWDERWQEIMPWELRPGFEAAPDRPFTVWKRNYLGDESSYELNYGQFSGNASLDSFNNQVTAEWTAVSNGEQGLLLSQCASSNMSAAFCPMRLDERNGTSRLTLNPFGTYHGKQWRYQTKHTGLGRAMALRMADHLDSYAPSYNGETVRFSLMIAPFEGDRPSRQACLDACLHAYPPLVLAGDLPFISVVPQDAGL